MINSQWMLYTHVLKNLLSHFPTKTHTNYFFFLVTSIRLCLPKCQWSILECLQSVFKFYNIRFELMNGAGSELQMGFYTWLSCMLVVLVQQLPHSDLFGKLLWSLLYVSCHPASFLISLSSQAYIVGSCGSHLCYLEHQIIIPSILVIAFDFWMVRSIKFWPIYN